MRTLIGICLTTLLITVVATDTPARVIANDLSENAVAVYYFSSQNDGQVTDYSGRRLHGVLVNDARIERVSGRTSLSLPTNAAKFVAWDDENPLWVNREFTIVAWVRIPEQPNDFGISVNTYNGPFANISENVHAGSEGSVHLGVDIFGDIYARYDFGDNVFFREVETIGRNVNNNRWHHIGFVINQTHMRLYLNGNRVANHAVSGHSAFIGSGIDIGIGEGARGSVDDVGVFRNDFSDAQVRLIRNVGLGTIMSIAPVDPNDKVATTWATLKQQ